MNKDSLVIWINGGFGVGKSETANALAQMDQGSHIYDPESVGYFLWHVFPPEMSRKGDFQDIPLWRSINLQVLHYLWQNHKGDIVVPMTISERRYYDEIIGGLRELGVPVLHVILTASRDEIVRRLRGRGEAPGSWAEEQIDRCLAAYRGGLQGIEIDTEHTDIQGAARAIMGHRDNFSVCPQA